MKSCLRKNPKRSASTEEQRSVNFSELTVHEFLIQIGDNPSCEGAPLCISNELQNESTHDIDEFENKRKKKRRPRKKLTLSPVTRSKMLMNLGYSMEDIASAAIATQKIRQERSDSLEAKKWDRFHLVAEVAKRKLKKMLPNKPEPEKAQITSRMA